MNSHGKPAPRHRERGNSFIEMSLIFIPLCAIIFFTLDISLMIFRKAVFQHAVREGVRWGVTYSSTYNGSPCSGQDACMKQVVMDNSLGFVSNASQVTVN